MTFHILGAIIPFDFHIFQWGFKPGISVQAPPRTVNLVGNVLFLPTGPYLLTLAIYPVLIAAPCFALTVVNSTDCVTGGLVPQQIFQELALQAGICLPLLFADFLVRSASSIILGVWYTVQDQFPGSALAIQRVITTIFFGQSWNLFCAFTSINWFCAGRTAVFDFNFHWG